jgi:hypothetical protein
MSKEKRQARKEARAARVKQRQASKTARQGQRQESKQRRQEVRQISKLAKVAKRKNLSGKLENLGSIAEAQKSLAAVKQPETIAKMKAYVENQTGEQIEDGLSPEELAAQANELRNEEIADTQDTLNDSINPGDDEYTEDEAEQFLYDMYDADSFDGENDIDNYDPATAAAVAAAAKTGVNIVAQKRAAKGKKTAGMTPEELKKLLSPQYADKPATSDIGKTIEAGIGTYKTETAKTNSDTIIFIVFVLIIIGVYIGLSKK